MAAAFSPVSASSYLFEGLSGKLAVGSRADPDEAVRHSPIQRRKASGAVDPHHAALSAVVTSLVHYTVPGWPALCHSQPLPILMSLSLPPMYSDMS